MSVSEGQRGLDAVKAGKWEEAISLLDRALKSSNNPSWTLSRAQAHQKLKNHNLCLRDAENAYHAAISRASSQTRMWMVDAQYRRGVALFGLGRLADAECALRWSMRLAEGRPVSQDDIAEIAKRTDENGFYNITLKEVITEGSLRPATVDRDLSTAMKTDNLKQGWARANALRIQLASKLQNLQPDDPARKISVAQIPIIAENKLVEPESDPDSEDESTASVAKPAAPVLIKRLSDEQLTFRAEFYQNNQTMSLCLFLKGAKIDKDTFRVNFGKNKITIGPLERSGAPYIRLGDRESYSTLNLVHEIHPTKSTYRIGTHKLEFTLHKVTPGKWAKWGDEVIGVDSRDSNESSAENDLAEPTATMVSASAAKANTGPVYPTSSRSGPKNWDNLVDANDDNSEDKDVNSFFQLLYKNAPPDQKRAMMKSFIESNGTALSTNWADVKDKKMETTPPEGAVAKNW